MIANDIAHARHNEDNAVRRGAEEVLHVRNKCFSEHVGKVGVNFAALDGWVGDIYEWSYLSMLLAMRYPEIVAAYYSPTILQQACLL